ncbi:MAG: MBOAT family protein [Candidatus Omnitrophica bacterium]|nr:MBOAT family protein [Candidatus Omnitrophota bacterium]
MLFNSFAFVLFAVVVYALYLVLDHRGQNILLFVASVFFYAWWDWRFLGLLFFSILLDFWCGRRIFEAPTHGWKRFYLILSLIGDLGVLFLFKYFDFFVETAGLLLQGIGMKPHFETLHLILPLGISFYTFQTLSYSIDIYRGDAKPTRNLLDFAVYVLFFPQLVAGPIERSTRLLPQIASPRTLQWNRTVDGIGLILQGYFKKVVIADNLAPFVMAIYQQKPVEYVSGCNILLATYAFAFQIYCDFSGYSDIARGLGKILGIELMVNFRRPYFAANPSEFWRRWHISLSTWLRDYLYIPLGGNRHGEFNTYRNLMVTMLLGGLWHGAATHFVLWGAFHGALLAIHRAVRGSNHNPIRTGRRFYGAGVFRCIKILLMFHLTCCGWFLFAVDSEARMIGLFDRFVHHFDWQSYSFDLAVALGFFLPIFLIYEIASEYWSRGSEKEEPAPWWAKSMMYSYMLVMIILYGVMNGAEFIYFQF